MRVAMGLSLICAAVVGGCGLVSENATSVFVAPGKFDHYNCEQLAEAGQELSERERELTELTVRAAQTQVGEFVGAVAYRTELMQARGQLKQIKEVAEQKNCALQSKWQSGRALW